MMIHMLLLLTLLLPGMASSQILEGPGTSDAIDDALAVAGMTRTALGWETRGYWERYPQDVPYKLRHFDDLCAEPLAIPQFLRGMGATLRSTLAPEMVAGTKGERGAGALYRAVHDLGVNKLYGATRPYSANLTALPTSLEGALLQAWSEGERASTFVTFGQAAPYPRIDKDLSQACAELPDAVSSILGKLFLDLLDARRWAVLGFRNVPLEMQTRIASRLDLGAEETDALEYEPAMDDAIRLWDQASLWYSGLKAVEALDVARLALEDTLRSTPQDLSRVHIDLSTPVGRLIVDGSQDGTLHVGDSGAFLIVDLGGNDHYTGRVAGSGPLLPVSSALDLGGDDLYEAGDGALGVGRTGIGVLLDSRGSDTYRSATLGQGAGHFGLGALIDLEGHDSYEVHYSGQGAGFFGIGLLIDLTGNDHYTIWSDGQGFGGVAGVGVLADRTGDDAYLAVTDPAVTGRPSYHSEGKIAVSDAQGCAMGRRGDGADGHSWAAGIGALLDAEGADRYTAGNWAQGCGYWFGTGLLWDGAGNDEYLANGWASASGAHFCIGALVDESGDDIHTVSQNWGPGFGHDFTAAVFVDAGGDDRYECGGEGVGHSINRSVVLFLEALGDDTYHFAIDGKRPGLATYDGRFLDRSGPSIYWTESTSIGFFLDAGGTDTYPAVQGIRNDSTLTDEPGSKNELARNRGIFVDRPAGRIDLDRPSGGEQP